MKTIFRWFILTGMLGTPLACKKFVEIAPPDSQITSQAVFTDAATVNSTFAGIYSRMMTGSYFASGSTLSLNALTGLSSDELVLHSSDPDRREFYTNAISTSNATLLASLWKEPYTYIYTANSILEGLESSRSISDSVKKILSGEARFIRAFCHFYLVNLFGDIPLITTSDYRSNATASRVSRAKVFQQIQDDLQHSAQSLPADYSASNDEKVRPNRWAALAMLARVNLYAGNWSDAEKYATSVIEGGVFELMDDLDAVFLANSAEAIWQLVPVVPGLNTGEGNIFILNDLPTDYTLSAEIMNAFEMGDRRKEKWTGVFVSGTDSFYYPFKYKIKTGADLTEYSMLLRLAEVYLIRSEARAMQNNIAGAEADLNTIRARAGLGSVNGLDHDSLLAAIMQERKVELFTEWGHRWLDLKRTGMANTVLSVSKFPGWNATDTLYPIPQPERLLDPNLSQNPGY